MDTSKPTQQAERLPGLSDAGPVLAELYAGQQRHLPPSQHGKGPTNKRIRVQTEKRKEQNRSNQRAFRQRKERYVRDLEVSHQNLRQLVAHQGDEIEALKARLIDLSGREEGPDLIPATQAAAPARDATELELHYESPSEGQTSPESEGSEDGTEETLFVPRLSRTATEVEAPPLAAQLPTTVPKTAVTPSMPRSSPHCSLAIIAPVPTPSIPMSKHHYWSAPNALPPVHSSFHTTVPSLCSSWSQPYTSSPHSAHTFDSARHLQPSLFGETALDIAFHECQPDLPRHTNNVSNWLQDSIAFSQYCPPPEEAMVPSFSTHYGFSKDSVMTSNLGGWGTPNTLGLDIPFP